MGELGTTFAIILVFTLIGGFFAASEVALVSLRESQINRLVEADRRRGPRLRALMENPNRFLASVQIGVTLAGFISAGFGASRIVPVVTPWLVSAGVPERLAETTALIASTVLIAYLSLVLGELVPKRLALAKAESMALVVATPLDVIARISRPFVWLLSVSTNLVVRIIGLDPATAREAITGEELRGMVAAHTELTAEERELIDDVFDAGDTELREVMIPRTEVAFLAASLPVFRAAGLVAALPHSRYPVIGDSPDDVLGFVHVRDILTPSMASRSVRLEDLAREVAYFPGSKQVIPALAEMRRGGHHLAVVADEYGGTAGIVTMEDLVEELVGDIHDEYDQEGGSPVLDLRPGAPFEVDGLLNLEDFEEESGVALRDGPYETVAGWFVAQLGRLPAVGDELLGAGARFEVIELDGRRISRIRVTPVVVEPAPSAREPDGSEG
ncbi:MAG: hemolysin family protein [Candidatus Nanopelagicales bacterium]|nr:hemolysin family protein [Candidatus Nanopelagicales bacterium]